MHLSILNFFTKKSKFLSIKSNKNDLNTLFIIGSMYYNGFYYKKDINKAIDLLSIAAEEKQRDAQNILGIIYNDLLQYNKAFHYFALAADQNEPLAQYNLGSFYLFGVGISQDIPKGIHYLILAADQGF